MNHKFVVEVNAQQQIVGTPVPYVPVINGIQISSFYSVGIFLAILAIGAYLSIFTVKQQSLKVVQRLGKFKKIVGAGLNFKIPFIDKIAGTIDLKINQLDVMVETKTKDNVFVTVPVSVQTFIMADKAYDAFYKLNNPNEQITAYVFDTVRSIVPTMTLDEVFEKKETIAESVKINLEQTMDDFGYKITTALVTDIDPAPKVKEAMNEINAQQRFREASIAKGEGEKILAIKKAEGEAESKKLQGEGIANERLAIVKGLQQSVTMMEEATGIKPEEVMGILMLTQYLDTMKSMGDKGNSTVFLPASPEGIGSLQNTIITAMKSSK